MSTDKNKLKTMKKEFINLLGLIDEAVDAFQFGGDGFSKLVEIIEKLDFQFETLREIKNNIEDDESPYLEKMIALSEETNQILANILTALESQDVVLLADLLQYELKIRLEAWGELVSKLLVKENFTN